MQPGDRIGHVTLVERAEGWHPTDGAYWRVACDCGDEGTVTELGIRSRGVDAICFGRNHWLDVRLFRRVKTILSSLIAA